MATRKKKAREDTEEGVSFEQAVERLEQIVAELEGGDLTLDASLARYEEGRKVIGACYKLLEHAESRIETLIKGEDGQLRIEPFPYPESREEPET